MFALPLRSSNPDFLYGKYAASLFASGERGVWYDPSDMSTMFQDAAGTTPVTAMEQPVGLILDKSKGSVLGSELVVSPYTGTSSGSWSISSTEVIRTPVTGGAILNVNSTFKTGSFYEVTLTVSNFSGDALIFRIGSQFGSPYYGFSGNGNKRFIAQVSGTGAFVWFAGITAGAGTAIITNISVRELPGNHATQTTTASRPVLSARYNLLTKTEQFNDAYWIKTGTTAQANVIQEALVSSRHSVESQAIFPAGIALRLSVEARPGSSNLIQMTFVGTPSAFANFDLVNGVVTASGDASGGSGLISASIQQSTDGYYRCTLVAVLAAGTMYSACISLINDSPTASRNPSYLGTGKSVFVRNIDVRVANESSSLPAYQRVNTATDYDTQGFPPYLRFDGVDDWLVTQSIDFTSTDKITAFAGVRKLSDTTRGLIVEQMTSGLSGGISVFALSDPQSNGASSYAAFSASAVALASVLAPSTNVLTGIFAPTVLSAQTTLKVNGGNGIVADGNITASMVNQPITIGRRGTGVHPFNGRLYGLILRGAQTGTTDLTNVERYLANKSGIVL